VMLIARNHQFLHRDVVAHPAYFVAKNIYDDTGSSGSIQICRRFPSS